MLSLSAEIDAYAVDLRGFGDSETAPVDATRGLSDFSDDLAEVVAALGLEPTPPGRLEHGRRGRHAVRDRPPGRSLTLISPVSPYGFGGTALDGSLLTPDAAGTGGGGANPDFVARLEVGDRSGDAPTSPRNVYLGRVRQTRLHQPVRRVWVTSMRQHEDRHGQLSRRRRHRARTGQASPRASRGVLNTMAPTHLDLTGIVDIDPKPPICGSTVPTT